MNPIDRSLQRLLNAAARAPGAALEPLPPALERRTLAHWRSASTEDEFSLLFGLFRRAAIYSLLIMTLSAGWTWLQSRSEASGAVALANFAMTIQEPP